jgi:hypothetical protein
MTQIKHTSEYKLIKIILLLFVNLKIILFIVSFQQIKIPKYTKILHVLLKLKIL